VPPEVDAFLAEPNPAVVATVSPSGAPHTAATWYDWEDGRVLLNISIEDDPELAGIDRLSIRYSGEPFHSRDARRVTAWMEPERWTGWPLPR
jgi:hypothetical protein